MQMPGQHPDKDACIHRGCRHLVADTSACSRILVMATHLRIILALSLLLLAGCDGIAGGGGSVNVPPDAIAYGHTTSLRLELSVWGAGSGKITNRYTEVRCHYKPEKATTFTSIEGRIETESKDRMFMIFDLPPYSAADGAYVEYYFDMKLDGHHNKRGVERVPLR